MAEAKFTISATDKTKAAFKSARTGLAGVAKQVINVRAAIATLAGSAGIGLLVAKNTQAIVSTQRLAERLDTTTKAMGGLEYAAMATATPIDRLTEGVSELMQRVGEADQLGTGSAAEALEKLGLSARELAEQRPEDVLGRVADALNRLPNAAARASIADELMGGDSRELLNLLQLGSEGINQLAQEAVELGYAVDDVDATQVARASAALSRSGAAIQAVGRSLTVELAPFIEAAAQQFIHLAKQSGGFGSLAVASVEGVAVGVAKLADVFRGLHAVWKGLEVAFAGVAAGIWQTISWLVGGIDTALSKLPFVGEQFGGVADVLGSISDNAADRLHRLQIEFDTLLMQPMPSENVTAVFDDIRAKAEESAKAVADSRAQMAAGAAGGDGGGINLADQERLNKLRESFASEMELEQAKFEEKRTFLLEANATLFQDELERKELLAQLEADHQARITEIAEKGYTDRQKFAAMSTGQQVATVLGELEGLTAGVAVNNKKMFELNKIAGIGNAIINTAQGVTKALSAYPPPLSFAMAAAQFAAGMAQVSAIKSASFGSSGAAPSVSGTTGASDTVATTPLPSSATGAQSQPSVPNVTINMGDGWVGDKQSLHNLVDALNEAHDDGYKLRIA